MNRKIFTEGPLSEWLNDLLFGPLNAKKKEVTFERTTRLTDADIIFSSDIEKLKKHLKGNHWNGTLAVLITDEPEGSKTKTWNGRAYIEISTEQLGVIILEMTLRALTVWKSKE